LFKSIANKKTLFHSERIRLYFRQLTALDTKLRVYRLLSFAPHPFKWFAFIVYP
jgi:hypothetical protein